MKKTVALVGLILSGALACVRAGQPQPWQAPPPAPQDPVPVYFATGATAVPVVQQSPAPAVQPVYAYSQALYLQQHELVSDSKAQEVVDEFRTNYPKLGSPRILIYVNRELVDEKSGLKIGSRSEKVITTKAGTADSTVTAEVSNTYSQNAKTEPTLADRQTVRDVERLMGRPMRSAGATLVDQRTASQLIRSLSPGSLGTDTDAARKDREAASQIADVAIEVLISSRNVNATEIDGVKVYSVPDIQMTAIRLKDSKIIGQATAADVINKAGGPAVAAKNFSVQDITEVTTLALMDDINLEFTR